MSFRILIFDAQVKTRVKVKGESMTLGVELLDSMGNDLTVVNAARVSFGKRKEVFDEEKDSRLIRYLARNKHTSPFGHCFASFHVYAPVFVARQLVKHKFLRWNEISRRYVSTPPAFFEPSINEWRLQADNKKQGSSGETAFIPEELQNAVSSSHAQCLLAYNDLISRGIAAEQARLVLPQSMFTQWIWSGSLDAFADMCLLRMDDHAQEETRVIAVSVSAQMAKIYPVSWQALLNV